jgi:putative aldouronate transport system substrate-binding protein
MKTAITELNKWYDEGLIDPEFTIKGFEEMSEDFLNGKSGICAFVDYFPLYIPDFMTEHTDGELHVYSGLSVDDKPYLAQSNGEQVTGYTVVNANCEHPEALMKLLNFVYYTLYGENSQELSPDGVTTNANYYNNPEGADTMYLCVPVNLPITDDINMNRYKIAEAVEKRDPEGVTEIGIYDMAVAYLDGEAPENWSWWEFLSKGCYAVKEICDEGRGFRSGYQGLPTDTETEKGGLIKDTINEHILKMITGESEIDSEFDKMIEDFYSMGGTEWTAEVNEWYDANKE